MILLSGLIFQSSVMTFGKQVVVYQSAVTVICSLRRIVAIRPAFDTNVATIFFETLRERMTFVGFSSPWNTQTADCRLFSGS
ncbi:unnamed protein product [Acanthoscelides obtectus]|uniref:Secreted protein n=1 Tax=Acanthoscelides obtectus TaxID=200917 RepID=A0A9P0KWC1_ACAOB|nr:unnamed protein product [Acanthoscelides obtectus]CAK1654862.1 hypothetical protein AOBTE_LOCUS18902 [Acanthoscelides obtectus]